MNGAALLSIFMATFIATIAGVGVYAFLHIVFARPQQKAEEIQRALQHGNVSALPNKTPYDHEV
jgi:hypothetical protein